MAVGDDGHVVHSDRRNTAPRAIRSLFCYHGPPVSGTISNPEALNKIQGHDTHCNDFQHTVYQTLMSSNSLLDFAITVCSILAIHSVPNASLASFESALDALGVSYS